MEQHTIANIYMFIGGLTIYFTDVISIYPIFFIYPYSDDTLPSEDPPKKIRILCWVMTSIENLDIRAIYVKKTWGKRCDILLFASDIENKTFGTIDINPGTGRQNLPNKTQEAFDYIYAHHIDDSDWFLKCDDDTYVIMENLRYFLSPLDTTVPLFFGHHFIGEGGYFSGGAGYVLSKEALTRYGQRDKSLRACSTNFIAEDVMMGSCLKGLGVHLGDSHDTYNKSRFHCFTPQEHIKGDYYPWYLRYDSQGAKHVSSQSFETVLNYH